MPPGQLHRDLSDGQRARRDISQGGQRTRREVSQAERVKDQPTEQPTPTTFVEDLTQRRLVEIEQYMGWGESPTLLLAAVPRTKHAVPIPGFYNPNGIAGCVSNPPEIRPYGFSLAWARLQNVDGSLVNTSAKRSILWVDPDGACFAAAIGTQDFLTRGGSRAATAPEPPWMNPTVLVEWTYLFCLFVKQCVAKSVSSGWTIAARLRGGRDRDRPLRLAPGVSKQFLVEGYEVGMSDWFFEVSADLDPGADSYRLLAAFYQLFGLDDDAIPYVLERKVNPEMIQAIR